MSWASVLCWLHFGLGYTINTFWKTSAAGKLTQLEMSDQSVSWNTLITLKVMGDSLLANNLWLQHLVWSKFSTLPV